MTDNIVAMRDRKAEVYVEKMLQGFINDPPDSEFQWGFLEALCIVAGEGMQIDPALIAKARMATADVNKAHDRNEALTRDDYRWEAADEITRLEARVAELHERLEVDPSHPYDGIYCRNETIRLQDVEIDRLTARVKELEEGLTWIDQQRYTDRSTINPDNAFEKAASLNRKLVAVMDKARALLSPALGKGGDANG